MRAGGHCASNGLLLPPTGVRLPDLTLCVQRTAWEDPFTSVCGSGSVKIVMTVRTVQYLSLSQPGCAGCWVGQECCAGLCVPSGPVLSLDCDPGVGRPKIPHGTMSLQLAESSGSWAMRHSPKGVSTVPFHSVAAPLPSSHTATGQLPPGTARQVRTRV